MEAKPCLYKLGLHVGPYNPHSSESYLLHRLPDFTWYVTMSHTAHASLLLLQACEHKLKGRLSNEANYKQKKKKNVSIIREQI